MICLACNTHHEVENRTFICKGCLLSGNKFDKTGKKLNDNIKHEVCDSPKTITNFKIEDDAADDECRSLAKQKIQFAMPSLQLFSPADDLNLEIKAIEFSCQDCRVLFHNERDLREHQIFAHSNFYPSKFVKCYFTFKIVDNFDDIHTDNIEFNVAFEKENILNTPLNDNTSVYLVDKTPPVIASTNTLSNKKQQTVHSDDGVLDRTNVDPLESDTKSCFQCPECNKSFDDGSSLDEHLALFDNPIEDTQRIIVCSRCSGTATSYGELQNHMRDVHRDYRNFECPCCFALHKTLSELVDHQNLAGCNYLPNSYSKFHKDLNDTLKMNGVIKDEFNNNTSTAQSFMISVPLSAKIDPEQEKEFKCHICSTEFSHPQSLEYHVKSIHKKIRDFVCEFCNRAFSRRSILNQHVDAIHHKIKKFECNLCPFKSLKRFHLKNHIRVVHEKERPFECELCSKSYPCKWSLDHHIKSFHNKIYDQMCNVCGRAFVSKRMLMLHIRKVHDNIKDYKCSHCKKSFDNKDALSDHLNEDHEGAPNYQCSQCAMTTIFISSFRKHMKNAHGTNKSSNGCGKSSKSKSVSNNCDVEVFAEVLDGGHVVTLKTDDMVY